MELTTKSLVKTSLFGLALVFSGCTSDGTDGLAALVNTSSEAPGLNCADGGMIVDIGLDANGNGILEIGEIDSTKYVCNGEDGATGADGLDGAPGADGLDGAPGTDGLDGAPGADGLDGAPGADGLDGAPGTDGLDGAPGADGLDGAPGADGLDGAPGTDGLDGAPGTDGLTALILTATEAAGNNCVNGGMRIDVGLDDNGNGIFEVVEIDSTSYVCNGEDGLTGADGLTSLINTTTEPAGANCADGGTKVDIGLDDDGNGTLETAEIDSTSYVCDGADGVDGIDGTAGTILVNTTYPVPCPLFPANATQLDIGLDDDGNGTLEIGEIDDTAVICDGSMFFF